MHIFNYIYRIDAAPASSSTASSSSAASSTTPRQQAAPRNHNTYVCSPPPTLLVFPVAPTLSLFLPSGLALGFNKSRYDYRDRILYYSLDGSWSRILSRLHERGHTKYLSHVHSVAPTLILNGPQTDLDVCNNWSINSPRGVLSLALKCVPIQITSRNVLITNSPFLASSVFLQV
ncbi:hypothetical protein C8R44DRAFT_746644 [Mycena epipterygia]|nr:hypothetical protein C8R44DRAFT_746644 [Mycena epipterygia]